MKYYKITLESGDELFHESKSSLTEQKIIEGMVEQASLSPVEVDEVESIEEITEDEYEECVI